MPTRSDRARPARLGPPPADGQSHRISIDGEVPFHDVDAMRIVWHGHYYKYFELARTALLRSVGLDAGETIGPRYRFTVIETTCRYSWPLAYADRFRCSAWVEDSHRRLVIRYEITNLTAARRAARGRTVLAYLDARNELLLETPHEIRALACALEARATCPLLLASASLAQGASAGDGPPALETLFARVSRIPGLEARFQEERRLALLAVPLRSEGRLYFAPPARLARRTERPVPALLLLDGDRLWFGDDAGGHSSVELDARPGPPCVFVEGFTSVLAGDLGALQRDFTLRFTPPGADGGWRLELTPRLETLTHVLARIEIRGIDIRISEVRVVEATGDETLTRFSEVNVDRHFDAAELARLFDPPAP